MMLQGSQGGLKFPTPTLLNTASLPAPGQALGSLRWWGVRTLGPMTATSRLHREATLTMRGSQLSLARPTCCSQALPPAQPQLLNTCVLTRHPSQN